MQNNKEKKVMVLDDGAFWKKIENMAECVDKCNAIRIRDSKEIDEILRKYNFELSYSFLSENCQIDDAVLSLLCEWLEKYQCSMKELFKLRMEYNQYLLSANELPDDDPRYDDSYSCKVYPKSDAPAEAYKFADMENDFALIECHLPDIEFTGEYLMS